MGESMKRLITIIALVFALSVALTAEQVTVSQYENGIRLLNSTPNHMVLELTLGHFNSEPVQIDGATWHNLSLKKEGLTLEAGYPQLPILARSVIIPNSARMELSLVGSEYIELTLPVAPSKGNLTRDIDPDSVPYSFADLYNGTGSWPESTSYLTEPFILRDYRGITVRFQPFEYFPATQTLRVYTKLQVALDNSGTDYTNSLAVPKTSYAEGFSGIYENMFLNFGQAKYPSLAEEGRILVIKHSMFDATIQPWVDWKRQNGYTVDVVDVSVAGPTANQIKTYIQNQYNLGNGLMFVQIVGDAPQVPTLTSGGGGSDPSYALLAGTDSYPDIYVGRFSAQTVAELQTQIQRSVYYERDIQPGALWLQKGMGIASNEGGGSQGDNGESDQTHIENIRTDLLAYGHTSVDQMYQTMGATAAQVGANVNLGRGIITYCGHGSDTYWVTTGFSNTNVNALVNDNMLPFIVSVACVNGNFVSQTCFAEAWLRSVNEGTSAPAGAIAFYGSTINQGWNPPMRGQDEVIDLLVAEQKHTVGGLLFNGSSKMIEVYGSSGINEYKCWTIFGDASLMVRTKDPQVLTATYSPVLFIGMSTMQVETIPGARVTLSANGTVYGSGIVDASGVLILNLSMVPIEPMDLTLTITAFNKVTHQGVVQVLPSTGPYIMVDTLVASDGNNNLPEFGEAISLNVNLNNIGSGVATGISVAISSTDPYINILNNVQTAADIAANGSGGTTAGFPVQIANNVPDQHVAPIHIVVTLADSSSYSADRSFTIGAPAFTWGGIVVNDGAGNNNGRIDAGESVTLSFPITNTGHSAAGDINTALVINDVAHVADPVDTYFTVLPADSTLNMVYNVTFSSQIPAGTTVNIGTMLFSGDYSSMQNYSVNIGIVAESFNVDFSAMPWTFAGGTWLIDPATSYNGSNAARSATITHSQSTSMSVTLTSVANGTISFWKKVSSEPSYDMLKFFINGALKNQWSGTNDTWSQVSYQVLPGNNTYKWEYVKDSYNSAGSDCAWIDDIVFPSVGGTTGAPNIALDVTSLAFGNVLIGCTSIIPFTIQNTGDAVLIGTVSVPNNFQVALADGTPNYMINVVVPAQSNLTVNVSFQPEAYMQYSGTMQINTDDLDTPLYEIPLSGFGQVVANDDPVTPLVTELRGNYPNPFNPETTISYSVKESAPVQILVYNLKGQLVRTLVNEAKPAGNHSVVFNGLDDSRRSLSSGVYFFKMRAGKYTDTRKMILMK